MTGLADASLDLFLGDGLAGHLGQELTQPLPSDDTGAMHIPLLKDLLVRRANWLTKLNPSPRAFACYRCPWSCLTSSSHSEAGRKPCGKNLRRMILVLLCSLFLVFLRRACYVLHACRVDETGVGELLKIKCKWISFLGTCAHEASTVKPKQRYWRYFFAMLHAATSASES